jgi:sarcosine oxidase subunit alpha
MSDVVEIIVNGRRVRAFRGATVAAALLDANELGFRSSPTEESRAPLCGMGICYECRVTIDDVPHRRACMTPVVAGMTIVTSAAT